MKKTGDIQIRDPFVVPIEQEKRYYLYGTTDVNCWGPPGVGFDVFTSTDLKHWKGPLPAFRPPKDFWSDHNFWAPEVHRVSDRYFMFASFKAKDICRGTQILVSDSPKGPFSPHSERPLTPSHWESLDGTLYFDKDNYPWMVFCHEWIQVHDGEICAVRLSPEFDQALGEPILLFRASEAPWVLKPEETDGATEKPNLVTDGPFLHRTKNGTLLMLWSSFSATGYTTGVARSLSGEIHGPWLQDPEPIYAKDGGHAMLFRTFEGQLMLSLHTPNKSPHERALFLPIAECEGRLHLL
ncbi:MAG TPA: glycoside hydrolase family 43 protein [bacterium]|nr:glycoside hydrolase family 43 protein [bacterium]